MQLLCIIIINISHCYHNVELYNHLHIDIQQNLRENTRNKTLA